MRRYFLGILTGLTLFSTAPAWAQDDGVTATIQSQLNAFIARDVIAAWDFASPTIQQIFRTPENFGAMVQGGYPMVWTPADVVFLDAEPTADGIRQRVLITDAAGQLHGLIYDMIPTEDGWKINGVALTEAPGLTA